MQAFKPAQEAGLKVRATYTGRAKYTFRASLYMQSAGVETYEGNTRTAAVALTDSATGGRAWVVEGLSSGGTAVLVSGEGVI